MKRNQKVIIAIITAILVFATPICAYAASGSGRAAALRSYGTIYFHDSTTDKTVNIDSSDFVTLADMIDDLEVGYKSGVLSGLNTVGSYFDENGYISHDPDVIQPEAVNLSMGALTDAISHSQDIFGTYTYNDDTYDVLAAIADNISLGKGAWVNGSYIVGNGTDVNNAYSSGVADGIAQGLSSANISITAHFHKTGDQTFVSDDESTAYEKYEAYLNAHNDGESSNTQGECYQIYKSGTTTLYSTGKNKINTYTRDSSGALDGGGYCNGQDTIETWRYHFSDGSYTDRDFVVNHNCGQACSRNDPGYVTGCNINILSKSVSYAYYTPDCGYTNGQILAIEIILN